MEKGVISSINDSNVVNLPKIHIREGNLTALENIISIPFEIKRVYYLYDIPGGEVRGGHAHKKLEQYLIAVSGAFDVVLDDGSKRKTVRLDRPYYALHIVPGTWREIKNFSSGAVVLVLASEKFHEDDYIRDYPKFKKYRNEQVK
jgi:dTDP-4-dehydrorhamnose 3,5-epimerase-like enzyme